MFFKMSVFKKMLKEAYKYQHLTIGKTEAADYTGEINREGIYLSGRYWEMWIDLDAMPKEAKAAIIELAGEFPEKGQFFTASKEGNQYEIEREQYLYLMDRAKKSGEEYRITKIMFSKYLSSIRILQNDAKEIVLVDDICTSLIDNGSIMYQVDEMTPIGPVSSGIQSAELYWWNYHCAFGMMPIAANKENLEEMELLGLLARMELPPWI